MDITLISSIAALILAVIAIWLSLHHKKETDNVHKETRNLLTDIKSDAKSIASYATPELMKYGDAMREYIRATSPVRDTLVKNEIEELNKIDETFSDDDLINLIKITNDRIGVVTPVGLIIKIKDKISADDLLSLMISLNKKGLIEWDSQPRPPKGDEEIRLTKSA